MAQEMNDGIAYLRALRQSDSHAVHAEAPAFETTPPTSTVERPGPQDNYQGAEKRRSPRFKCEGSAEMREEKCDVRTWATFTDISLHGCYVEAQATYPVGTILHLKLEANGLRVETKGNVRVSYPYLGMGIAFTEMSEENQEQLKELLGGISRPAMIMGPGIASSLPARDSLQTMPVVSNPQAALQALIDFFENRQLLMRNDFLRIVTKSQATAKQS
jgi:hypothetical protein